MTAYQPTPLYLTPPIQLWELACLRWRPISRHFSAWHPTIQLWERACSRRRP